MSGNFLIIRIRKLALVALVTTFAVGAMAGVAQAAAPTNVTPPVVSGTPQAGQTLTYTSGTWSDPTAVITDQWWECNPGCAAIPGTVNQPNYPLTAADVGGFLYVEETATDSASETSLPQDSTAVGPVTAAPPPPVPVAQSAPSISGTPQLGQTLAEAHGSWTNSPTGYAYQWLRCDGSGNNCVGISGANGQTYTLVTADVGSTISVQETASNGGGPGSPSTSAAVGPVTGVPVAQSAPTISGTAQLGQTLTEAHGSWSNSPTSYAYRWMRCDPSGANCVAIAGAASRTYTLVAADVGSTIAVEETATNGAGTGAPTTSAAVGPVTGVPVAQSAPTISGTPQLGQTLAEAHGSWTNSPTGYAYRWLRCDPSGANCAAIAGAASRTYTLVAADVGSTIAVEETASNGAGTGAPSTSAAYGPVTGAPANISAPTITGSTYQTQTLSANPGNWTNNPTFAYLWQRCDSTGAACAGIAGATGSTYVLVAPDVGSTIRVVVRASNTAGSADATSAATAVIAPPPPGLNAPPTISGTAQQGMTLTEVAARWSNNPTSIAIQWYRCDSNGLNCAPEANGTGKAYTLTAADVGALIQVSETAANASDVPVTALSPLVGPVLNLGSVVPVPGLAGPEPTISGTPALGQTLLASGATFTNNAGTFSYQWLRCGASGCVAIPGATGLTYTVSTADIGDAIAFTETASNSGGTSQAASSIGTNVVTAPSTTSLQVSPQAPAAGQALTLITTVASSAGSIPPSGSVTIARNGVPIPGCQGLAVHTASVSQTMVCQTAFNASASNVAAVFTAATGTFVTGSSSPSIAVDAARATSSTSLSASSHVNLGTKATYTTTVSPPAGNVFAPSGTVTFLDGKKTISGCKNRALTGLAIKCTVKYVDIGKHHIVVRYTGDANFTSSSSATKQVSVSPQAPSGFVTTFMSWSFFYSQSFTRIRGLNASGLVSGNVISLICSGQGCPFARHVVKVATPHGCVKATKKIKAKKTKCKVPSTRNLTPIFQGARLRVGAKLTVEITHPAWLGKYYRFTVRRGRRPSIAESCLAVRGTRPGVGCSAR